MQVQKASRLGALHQILGIPADSRVSYQFTRTGGVIITDLNAGIEYQVQGTDHTKRKVPINPRVRELLAADNEELKKVWNAGDGWDEERELAFSELCERGVDMLAPDVF